MTALSETPKIFFQDQSNAETHFENQMYPKQSALKTGLIFYGYERKYKIGKESAILP